MTTKPSPEPCPARKHLWRYHALYVPGFTYRTEPLLFAEVLECEKCGTRVDTNGRPWQREAHHA